MKGNSKLSLSLLLLPAMACAMEEENMRTSRINPNIQQPPPTLALNTMSSMSPIAQRVSVEMIEDITNSHRDRGLTADVPRPGQNPAALTRIPTSSSSHSDGSTPTTSVPVSKIPSLVDPDPNLNASSPDLYKSYQPSTVVFNRSKIDQFNSDVQELKEVLNKSAPLLISSSIDRADTMIKSASELILTEEDKRARTSSSTPPSSPRLKAERMKLKTIPTNQADLWNAIVDKCGKILDNRLNVLQHELLYSHAGLQNIHRFLGIELETVEEGSDVYKSAPKNSLRTTINDALKGERTLAEVKNFWLNCKWGSVVAVSFALHAVTLALVAANFSQGGGH